MEWVSTKKQLPSSANTDTTELIFIKYNDPDTKEMRKEVVSFKDLIKFVRTTKREYFWLLEREK